MVLEKIRRYLAPDEVKRIELIIKLFNAREENMDFNLKDYSPEAPKEGVEAFKFQGLVNIEKSLIYINEDASLNQQFYPVGCNMINIEAIIMEGEHIGKKLFKRFNLDSDESSANGKTPVMKLADQLFAVGLEFKNLESLKVINEKFVGMDVNVKAWPIDFKDGRDKVQMWNIKGKASLEAAIKVEKEAVEF